jgi:pimeloyl-ACP methyl ester carboxylesterase
MFFTALLSKIVRAIYGPLPEVHGEGTGLVIVADGVGGLNLCGTALKYATSKAGVEHEIRVHPWGHGFGRWHADLTNVANHAAQSEALAAEVLDFRSRRPKIPVFLVGKSGGTGIVVKALERLPAGSIEVAVLLSPALSPRYDLSQALRAIQKEMVVFWSPLDLIVLGLGTQIFGTVDRVNAVSAGLVGFRPPEAADLEQYAKLRQVRWRPEMAPTGYLGGHVGPDHPAFLRKYVVPLLAAHVQSDEPSQEASRQAASASIT